MKKSIVFIIIAVIAVIAVYVSRYLDSPVMTQVARYTEIEEGFVGDAYFVREEETYAAQNSGTFYKYVDEGARVSKGKKLAVVYDGVIDAHALQELDNIQKKLEELETVNKNDIFTVDSTNVENRLKNLKNQVIAAAQKNNPEDIVAIKKSIKSTVSGEQGDDIQGERDELLQKKSNIETQINSSKEDIYSSISGMFSTNIDGLEEYFLPEKISEYTIADFDAASENIINPVGKTVVSSGEKVCKVIDNHTWYILIKVENEDLSKYEKGQQVVLKFDSLPGTQTEAEVLNISTDELGKSIMALKCEKYVEGIFSIRQSSVEVIAKQYSGFEIPISAVRVEDGVQGVMVQYGVNEVFKPCEIVYTDKNEDKVMIRPITQDVSNPLEQYDRIVIGEKGEKTDA